MMSFHDIIRESCLIWHQSLKWAGKVFYGLLITTLVTHASRPQEGSGDHRNDTANGQATTSVFSRYGKLHGDLHFKPLTSH